MFESLRARAAVLQRHPVVRFWQRFSATSPAVHAAAIAYNAFFSLVPAAAALLTLGVVLGEDEVFRRRTLRTLGLFAPGDVVELTEGLLASASERLGAEGGAGLVTGALLVVSLYSAARGMQSLQHGLSLLQDREEARPWWKARVVGIGLTVAAGAAFLLTTLILVAGRALGQFATAYMGPRGGLVEQIWLVVLVPIASVGIYLFLYAFYHFGPPRPLPSTWLAALLAGGALVLVSLGFQVVLARVGIFGGAYGSLAAVAVLLVWLFASAYVILLAAFFVMDRHRAGVVYLGGRSS